MHTAPSPLWIFDEDVLVNYFLNVYDEVEDPTGALSHYLEGDRALALLWLNEWHSLFVADLAMWRRSHGPEIGDRSLRAWLRGQRESVGKARAAVSVAQDAGVLPTWNVTVQVALRAGMSAVDAEIDPAAVRPHRFVVFSPDPEMARESALDAFHQTVAIGVLDNVEIETIAEIGVTSP